MTLKQLAILLSAAVAAQSNAALAASGDQLLTDLDAWETIEERDEDTKEDEEEDDLFQTSSDLFPDTTGEQDGAFAEFVTVFIDGLEVVFRDVPRIEWFAPYVRDIAERGIVSGYRGADGKPTGLFGPADNVTLEQVAKVLTIAAGHIGEGCVHQTINLTSSGSWSAPYVGCAEKHEWSVYADGSADMLRPATRAEVIMTLLEAYDVPAAARTGTAFTDVTASTQFGAAIEQAKNDGVISGYTDSYGSPTGLFGPEEPVKRAEFAKIVTLGMQLYGSK